MSDEAEFEIVRLLDLPYHRVVRGSPAEGYVASVAELPGCLTDGDTPVEALENLQEAMAAWFESHLLHGDPIPAPAAALAVAGSALTPRPPLPTPASRARGRLRL